MAGNSVVRLQSPPPHDRCDRKPEGRRRQDDHRHQPGGGPVDARQADAAHRSGSAGQQLDVVPGRHDRDAERLRRHLRAERRVRGRHPAVDQPNLFVAPSRIALAKLEAKLVGELDAHFRLKDRLDAIREQYPHIVIDCPPTLGPADRQRAGGGDAPADSRSSRRISRWRARTTCSRPSRRCGRAPTRRCGSWAS